MSEPLAPESNEEFPKSEPGVSDVQKDPTWTVWRQDDSGNRFVISANLTADQAQAMVADFEARGHKQGYWCTKEAAA